MPIPKIFVWTYISVFTNLSTKMDKIIYPLILKNKSIAEKSLESFVLQLRCG